jgi:hypothetical protein
MPGGMMGGGMPGGMMGGGMPGGMMGGNMPGMLSQILITSLPNINISRIQNCSLRCASPLVFTQALDCLDLVRILSFFLNEAENWCNQ